MFYPLILSGICYFRGTGVLALLILKKYYAIQTKAVNQYGFMGNLTNLFQWC